MILEPRRVTVEKSTNRRLAITCSDIAAGWQRAADAILRVRQKVLGVLAYLHFFNL